MYGFVLSFLLLMSGMAYAMPDTACRDSYIVFEKGETSQEQILAICQPAAENGDASAAWRTGKVYEKTGNWEAATHWYEVGSEWPEASVRLGLYWVQKGDFDKAAFFFNKAGDYPQAVEAYVAALFKVGKQPDAQTIKRLEASAAHGSAQAQYLIGKYFFLTGQKSQAAKYFKLAATAVYDPAIAWNHLLQGNIIQAYDAATEGELFWVIANDKAASPEIQIKSALKAREMNVPEALYAFFKSDAFAALEKEDKKRILEQLSGLMYADAAQALATLLVGEDQKKAWDMLSFSAMLGNKRAYYMEVMRGEAFPPYPPQTERRAKQLNEIAFNKEMPEDIQQQAQKWLAHYFLEGVPPQTAPNPELADKIAEKIHFTDEEAFEYGNIHLTMKRPEYARKWFLQASKSSNKVLQYELSRALWETGDKDISEELVIKSAEGGYAPAMFMFSRILEQHGKIKDSYAFLYGAADKDYPIALYTRAMLGLSGKVVRSGQQIVEDLNLALAGGFAEAGLVFSKLHAEGKFVPKDSSKSAKYAHAAALKGSPEAMLTIGVYALKGFGMKIDRTFAAMWLSRAASTGSKEAADICRKEGFVFELPNSGGI